MEVLKQFLHAFSLKLSQTGLKHVI